MCFNLPSFLRSYAGGVVNEVPHPDVDWRLFMGYISQNNKASVNAPVFNSLTCTFEPWLNVSKLNTFYGDGTTGASSCAIM